MRNIVGSNKRQLGRSRGCGCCLYGILSLCLTGFIVWPATALADPLQGSVNAEDMEPARPPESFKMMEPMPAPVVPKKLEGNVQQKQSGLQGQAEDEGSGDLTGMTPTTDKRAKVLQGSANMQDLGAASDPDMDDQEMMVEWDRWRNRFLIAVQQGVQESLNNTGDLMMRYDPRTHMVMSKFPLGTVAWFSCQVTPTRHVTNLKLMQSSGFPNYDQAVLSAVAALDGSSILRYPRGSRRSIVSQAAGIKTADSPGRGYFHFGDVERYRTPAY